MVERLDRVVPLAKALKCTLYGGSSGICHALDGYLTKSHKFSLSRLSS